MTFLEQEKPIEVLYNEWIDNCYNKSKSFNSKDIAENAHKVFLEFITKKYPGKSEQSIISDLKTIQPNSTNYSSLYLFINEFVQYIGIRGNSPRTTSVYMAQIKSWLRHNGIRIYDEDVKQFVKMPKLVKERKVALTHDKVGLLLKNCRHEYFALILFLCSSGMRISEVLQLRVIDIDFTSNPVMVRVRAETTKLREERITFVSAEAVRALNVIIRDRTPKDFVFFPVRDSWERLKDLLECVECSFSGIRKRSGLLEKYGTGRYHIRIHTLRNFFISQCERVHEGLGHALAGHGKYMKEYENFTDEQLKGFYLKIEPDLTISNDMRNQLVISQKDEQLKKVDGMQLEIKRLQDMVQRLERSKH